MCASAAELEGSIALVDASPEELKRVVIYLTGFKQPAPLLQPIVMLKDRSFIPTQIAITQGQRLSFANLENDVHNPFANSSLLELDLGEMQTGDRRTVPFQRTGHFNIFCNVHSEMSLRVLVLPNRAFASPSADGRFKIKDIPKGSFKVVAWHPLAEPVQRVIAFGPQSVETATFQLRLVRKNLPHWNKHGRPYAEHR